VKKKHIKKTTEDGNLLLRVPKVLKNAIVLSFFLWTYFVLKYYFRSINFNPLNFSALNWIFSTHWYSGKFDLHNAKIFIEHFYSIFILLLILTAAYGIGKKIWILLKFDDETDYSSLEIPIFQTALGIGGIIFFTLGIGLAGLLYGWLIWCFILVFACVGLFEIKNLWKSRKNLDKKKHKLQFLPLIVVILACLVNLASALVPETFYDSLTYNVGLSQNWINHHKIFSTKFMHVSFYPLNFTVLYTVGTILKDEVVAKLLVFGFGLGIILPKIFFS
jgi:hypothetical protein